MSNENSLFSQYFEKFDSESNLKSLFPVFCLLRLRVRDNLPKIILEQTSVLIIRKHSIAGSQLPFQPQRSNVLHVHVFCFKHGSVPKLPLEVRGQLFVLSSALAPSFSLLTHFLD